MPMVVAMVVAIPMPQVAMHVDMRFALRVATPVRLAMHVTMPSGHGLQLGQQLVVAWVGDSLSHHALQIVV